MSDYLKAVIIGIVEGLTEFLPVSSTAHIRIVQQEFLAIPADDEFWKMFAIVIQLGAILAVLVYFARRISEFSASFLGTMTQGWQRVLGHPFSLVVLSFVVTALPCFLMDKWIGENLENLYVMATALIVGGVVMWVVDHIYGNRYRTGRMEEMTFWQAMVIGAAQILAATFPGTSRSMSTIAAGQIMGLSRPAALEFSFFLSVPVMVAATSYKLLKYIMDSPSGFTTHKITTLGIGFLVSFLVAWAVIAWLMNWVKQHGFVPFAVYRVAAGVILIGWLIITAS